jgi:bleomycin hydrolase
MENSKNSISKKMIQDFDDNFNQNSKYRILKNALTKNAVNDIALNRDVIFNTDHTFSHHLDEWPVTNQKSSGRCWIFAGLNMLRPGLMKKLNVKEFEFSQNYILFRDKLERANFFFENIIYTSDRDIDDRSVAHILTNAISDGGQWDMLAGIIKKYGLIPKNFMPETHSSANTGQMNRILLLKMQEGAKTLRDLAARKASRKNLDETKTELLKVIYRILTMHLGTPPEKFTWQWMDKDRKFHRDDEMTPRQFADKYLDTRVEDYICLVHDPRPYHPQMKTYTVEFLGNIVGGDEVKYLNVPIEVMKTTAASIIQQGTPVWFGCDVGKMMDRSLGVLDPELFEYQDIYDTTFNMDKTSRLEYHQTAMNHAMLFTGVDLLDGKPRRWRIENSWGDNPGNKGFFVMNDAWFNEHMFEIAAHKEHLSKEMLDAYQQPPIHLPAWDPMGSLAQ